MHLNITRLKKDIVLLYFTFAVSLAAPMLQFAYTARVLGPAEFGTLVIALAVGMFMSLIIDFGFYLTGQRELLSDDNLSSEKLAKTFFGVAICKAIIACLLVPTFLIIILYVKAPRDGLNLYVLATCFAVTQSLNVSWFFRGQEMILQGTIYETAIKSLSLIFVFSTLKEIGQSERFLLSLCAANIIGLASAMFYFKGVIFYSRPNFSEVFELFKRNSAFFFAHLLGSINSQAPILLLGSLSTPTITSNYASAEKVFRAAVTVLEPIRVALFLDASKVRGPVTQMTLRVIILITSLLFVLSAFSSLAIYFLADWIITLLYGAEYKKASEVLKFLAWIPLIVSINYSLATFWITPQKLEKYSLPFLFVALCLLCLLSMLWVPNEGAIGLALALLTVEAFMTLGTVAIFLLTARVKGR